MNDKEPNYRREMNIDMMLESIRDNADDLKKLLKEHNKYSRPNCDCASAYDKYERCFDSMERMAMRILNHVDTIQMEFRKVEQ